MRATPLSELRRRAPRKLTHQDLRDYFERRGLPRVITVFGNFERGEVKDPSEQFLKLYAAAVGVDVPTVVSALRRTQQMRARGTGPFAR